MPNPNTAPIYPGTPKKASVLLATANTARDGSGTLTTLYTAGSQGAFIEKVKAMSGIAAGSPSTAMAIRYWRIPGGSGSGQLIAEVLLPSATPSTTVLGASIETTLNTELAANDILAVTQTAAENVHHSAQGGDY